MNRFQIFVVVGFFVSLCIAIPTFLTGCDDNHTELCPIYKPTEAVVTDVAVSTKTCTTCSAYQNIYNSAGRYTGRTCVSYASYECYSVTIGVRHGSNNCTISVSDRQSSSAPGYSIGDKIIIYINTISNSCEVSNDGKNFRALTYTGLTFFGLAGLFFVTLVVMFVRHVRQSNSSTCSEPAPKDYV